MKILWSRTPYLWAGGARSGQEENERYPILVAGSLMRIPPRPHHAARRPTSLTPPETFHFHGGLMRTGVPKEKMVVCKVLHIRFGRKTVGGGKQDTSSAPTSSPGSSLFSGDSWNGGEGETSLLMVSLLNADPPTPPPRRLPPHIPHPP
jgi:hypothetical protein